MNQSSRLAYTAGFIEADGCFHIASSASIRITNKHLPTLERFQSWFGGRIAAKSSPIECYEWNIHAGPAAELATQLLPYLSMKLFAAQCLIEYQGTIGKKGQRLTLEVRAKREDIKRKLTDSRNVTKP